LRERERNRKLLERKIRGKKNNRGNRKGKREINKQIKD